jgi:V/A-type H+/Na+-transporting ATPase subunit E
LASESEQVRALQHSILERARELSAEHIAQGEMTRNKILEDAREKIKLMEQKELLAARLHSEREYQQQVQANELRIQAELDRNRWGLVQSVMDQINRQLVELGKDDERYPPVFKSLLKQAAATIAYPRLVASINNDDLARFHDNWQAMVKDCCAGDVNIELSAEALPCIGGIKLVTEQGDVMIDNTFEGIIARREDVLQRIIFERLFSSAPAMGGGLDG